ncbi:hypothetical protein PI125_g13566 [Phytophthora idaei]|nr:hypothetical protein PI125_g13566 [Phytophthora idaei]
MTERVWFELVNAADPSGSVHECWRRGKVLRSVKLLDYIQSSYCGKVVPAYDANKTQRGIPAELSTQHDLFQAVLSYLPRAVVVTPEWRTSDRKGFVGLVISSPDVLWFWQLFVNGDEAFGSANRSNTDGDHYESLSENDLYVFINFRQGKHGQKQEYEFVHVSFVGFFHQSEDLGAQ